MKKTAADKMVEVMTAEILRQETTIGGIDLHAIAEALIVAIQQDVGFHVWADLLYQGPTLAHNEIRDLQDTLRPVLIQAT